MELVLTPVESVLHPAHKPGNQGVCTILVIRPPPTYHDDCNGSHISPGSAACLQLGLMTKELDHLSIHLCGTVLISPHETKQMSAFYRKED